MSKKQPDGQNALFVFVLTLIIALTISILPSDDEKQNDLTLMEMVPSVSEHRLTVQPDSAAHAVADIDHDVTMGGHGDAAAHDVVSEEEVTAHEVVVKTKSHDGEATAAHSKEVHVADSHAKTAEVPADTAGDHAAVAVVDGDEKSAEEEAHGTDGKEDGEAPPAAHDEAEASASAVAATEAATEKISAGSTAVADVIVMENAAYEKHTKDIVHFTHAKHLGDYAIACGECHHDADGAPLADLKLGDSVDECAACHDKTGKAPKGASEAEKLEYHKQALHQNCIACHKEHNKANNTKAAPASCKGCHAHAQGEIPEGVTHVEKAAPAAVESVEVVDEKTDENAVSNESKEENASEEAAPAEEKKAEAVNDEHVENAAALTHEDKIDAEAGKNAAVKPEAAAEEAKEEPSASAPESAESAVETGRADVAEVIAMESAVYDKHKKGIVQFTHKKHFEDYAIACGACHHDAGGQPLADLKMGDAVEKCSACHEKAGKIAKEATPAEKLEFHKEALHQNCVACHKEHNKKNNTKAAPSSCKQCHPKTK